MANYESLKNYCKHLRQTHNLNGKTLFIKVPQMNLDIFDPKIAQSRGYQTYPPTGLQYLAEALEHDKRQDTRILDMNY